VDPSQALRDLSPGHSLIDPVVAPTIVIDLAIPPTVVQAPPMDAERENEAAPTGDFTKLPSLHAADLVHHRYH
jgi:hypothetical protein